MKKLRFTETRIIGILKEADAGTSVKEICRNHGISDATYYNAKYTDTRIFNVIQHGYTLKAIADHLGIHYTTVSKVIKTLG